jgi:hypothetical protein
LFGKQDDSKKKNVMKVLDTRIDGMPKRRPGQELPKGFVPYEGVNAGEQKNPVVESYKKELVR